MTTNHAFQRSRLRCDIHIYKDGEFLKTIKRTVIYGKFRNGIGYLACYQKLERPVKRVPNTVGEYRMDI